MAAIFFENKSGISITPYKERMIDGSESPNARAGVFIRVSRSKEIGGNIRQQY